MYKITLNVKCDGVSEDKLAMYIVSQLLGGPVYLEITSPQITNLVGCCLECTQKLINNRCINRGCKEYGKETRG